MRKALIVGVDYYEHGNTLYGCVNDAHAVKAVLERNGNGTINFDVKLLTSTSEKDSVRKGQLKDLVNELFDSDEDALFYFSGHGDLHDTGGYLITSECKRGDEGLSLEDLLKIANGSKAKNKIIILDCCFSGYFGSINNLGDHSSYSSGQAILSKGMTILTASSATQYAVEKNGSGIFTTLLIDALNGGAANILGKITPGSIYAHIDQSLGSWGQRPLFKTNIQNFISIRDVQPMLNLEDLVRITDLFNERGDKFQLDPTFEPTEDSAVKENTEKFAILQKYEGVGLVVPIGTDHMYYAALESKYCSLTLLGQHYWSLVKNGRI